MSDLNGVIAHKDAVISALENLNAELLAVMKTIRSELSEGDYRSSAIRQLDTAIAKAEGTIQ